MAASRGQLVEVMITADRWSLAVVSAIVSGNTVNLVAFPDGDAGWPLAASFATDKLVGHVMLSVLKGSTLGTWRDLALPTDTGGTFTVLATAGVDQTALGLDTGRVPSATRPTKVTASGYFSIVSDGTDLDGTIEIRAENANPATVQQAIQTARVNAAAGTFRVPWFLSYEVPAGHRYMLAKTVETGVTCVLSKITEQAG